MTPITTEHILMEQLLKYSEQGRRVQFYSENLTTVWKIQRPKGGFYSFKAWVLEDVLEELEFMDEEVIKNDW